MKKIASFLLLLLCTQITNAETPDESETAWAHEKNPVMVEAIKNARKTLDSFLQLHTRNSPNVKSYKLQVVVSDQDGTEQLWVSPFRLTEEGNYMGALIHEPKTIKSVSLGQTINFKKSMISDWGYIENGKQIGSYTVCAQIKSLTAEQVEFYKTNYGFDCK